MLAAVFGAFALGAFGPALARADEVPTPGATQPTRGAAQPTPGAAQPTPGAADPADSAVIEGPMRPDAQELYDRGLGRFQVRDYAGATADFEAGYAIEARREFLFAEGQSKRLAGDCKGAVPLYQRFLATGPPVVQVNATHIALGRCAQLLAARPRRPDARPGAARSARGRCARR